MVRLFFLFLQLFEPSASDIRNGRPDVVLGVNVLGQSLGAKERLFETLQMSSGIPRQ